MSTSLRKKGEKYRSVMLGLHQTQADILQVIKKKRVATFSAIRADVAETSDNLTYHLKKMVELDVIESPGKGLYKLGAKGLQYVNTNLDKTTGLIPVVSCMFCLVDSDDYWLVMEKLKQPNLGRVHTPTISLKSTLTLDEQFESFCTRYDIRIATEKVFKGIYRKRILNESGVHVFDKVFLVYLATLQAYSPEISDRKFRLIHRDALEAEGVIDIEDIKKIVTGEQDMLEAQLSN